MREGTAARDSGLDALDEQPVSPAQRYAAILVALGEFIDGYDLIVMGGALILLRPQFGLSASEVGALGASTFLGAMVGMLIFGDMSDRWGRRAIFVANLIFFVVFSILSAFVQTVPQLFIARFLVGIGVGMDVPTSAAYLAEIAPRHRRGIIAGSLLNITWILGAMTSTLIALPLIALTGDAAWRWMFGLAALPALLVLIGRQALPESPRWLIAHGRIEEARHALARFGIAVDGAALTEPRRQGSYAELFGPRWRKRVWLTALVFFLNCVAGPLSTIAAPYVLRTVGALSAEASSRLQCAGLADRVIRRVLRVVPDRPHRATAAVAGCRNSGGAGRAVHGLRRAGTPAAVDRRVLRLQFLQLVGPGGADLGVVE